MSAQTHTKRTSYGKQPVTFQSKKKLYTASLYIFSLYHPEDFLFLQSDQFLKLCEVDHIGWDFTKDWFNGRPEKQQKNKEYSFQFSQALMSKENHYGSLIFSSSKKFSQKKKDFLKKISSLTASTLHFIESREKVENAKRQWRDAFDSFPQAFCITNKNFKIIRANQAFQKMSQTAKTELSSKNLFDIVPAIKMPIQNDQEGAWLTKGEINGREFCWEVSFKPLFLRKEKTKAFLFLIKDITQEMEIEEKLSQQAKERELGLIKGSIAHELNNPIAGVKTLLSVIEKQLSPRKTLIKDSLKEMQRAVDRCHRIIRHLLFVSKNTGKPHPGLSLSRKTQEESQGL